MFAPISRATRHLALLMALAAAAISFVSASPAAVSADNGRPPLVPHVPPTLTLAPTPTSTPLYLAPDLLVNRIDPDWQTGRDRIEVRNQGKLAAGHFRVAILAGANSYSFDLASLGAGASHVHTLPHLTCKQPVAVLVDADHEVKELLEDNNGTGFKTSCPID